VPPAQVAVFAGAVRCDRPADGPIGLELTGRSVEAGGDRLTLAFVGCAPADLPAELKDAAVERTGEAEFEVRSGARAWRIAASAVHAHRDVGEAFYRVITPRRPPFMRRLLLRTAIAIAGSRFGLFLVRALRR
jgi:hypothetical protein